MNFKILQEGREINCEIVLTFSDENNNVDYVVYTDGTRDENNELEIYASRYSREGDSFVLQDIEHEYEWNLIDNMLEAKFKGNE